MNQPRFKRLVAVCLALALAFSGLLSTACKSGGTPTTPSPTGPEPQPIGTGAIRVLYADADSIEVNVWTQPWVGLFRYASRG